MQSIGVTYGTVKAVAGGVVAIYWIATDGNYLLFCGAADIFCLSLTTTPAEVADFEANLKHPENEVSSSDDATARVFLASKVPRLPTLDQSGLVRVASTKPDSAKVTFYTHDWSDPTTWYEGSTRVVNEAAVNLTLAIWQLAHVNVIDSYHGLITQEDFLKDKEGFSLRVSATVNGVAKIENDPYYLPALHNDFSVNYTTGQIVFNAPLLPGDVVLVTYHYAGNSVFTIAPAAGRNIEINTTECQFSLDVDPQDSVIFQPYGFVDIFAPQLMTTNGGKIPPGTKIPLGNPLVYKTLCDFQNDAMKSYPAYPAMGSAGNWRAAQQPIQVFNWDYVGMTVLRSAYGMEIRISLQHDNPFKGWFASATLYCLSYPQ